VHFCLINAIYYFNDPIRRKKTIKNLLLGILIFFLISGVWIGLISEKEDKFTYGTAGEFNHDLVGPNSKGWVLPQVGGDFSELESWSPFESWANFKYQLRIIYNNLIQIVNFIQYFSYFSILIMLFYIILCIRPVKELIKSYKLLLPLLTIIIFCGGYTPIVVEERYLWLVWVLLLLMGGSLLDGLFKTNFFNQYQKGIIVLIFALSFLIAPLTSLDANKGSGEDIYQIQNAINIPLSNVKSASNGVLDKSLYLSYYFGTDYVGQAGFKGNYSSLEKQLINSNVDVYFLWDDEADLNLENYTEVGKDELRGVKIYSKII
jgi:4-amino-4-deoxy-L-arabinose transferase-like glycosyltransferase